jgi:hypothetical protein
MQGDILQRYKFFKDGLPKREQTLGMTHKPLPNQVEIRKIKTNINKNNASEGKEL